MNSKEDAKYRLELASEFLKRGKFQFKQKLFREATDCFQLSIENSAKSIIAIFEPVEKSHDPWEQLKRLVKREIPLKKLANIIKKNLLLFKSYGSKKHILISYGDEKSFKTPWELFGKEEAIKALNTAEKCLKVAQKLNKYYE